MARGFGKKTTNVAAWVIISLLIVGLAGFGVSNFGGSVQTIGSVGDRDIAVDDYAQALQQALRQRSQQTGESLTLAEAESQGLTRRVLRQVVDTAALDNAADRLGLSAGDEVVRDRLTQISAFQGVDGNFDRQAYRDALEANGLTEAGFESDLRERAARSLLQNAVTAAVAVPDPYVQQILAYIGARRSYSFLRLTRDDLQQPVPEPSDEALQTYHDDNIARFTAPETKRITYAWLTPKMLTETVEIDEAALREAYEARSDEFHQPEHRVVDRLAFSDRAAAQQAMDAIDSGETTFEKILENRNLTQSDVALGEVAQSDLTDAAAKAVFALDSPGVVGPVPSELGPALFRMNAILKAQETSFEDARSTLRTELARNRATGAIDDLIAEVENKLAAGATLEALADETQLQLGEIAYTGNSQDGIAGYDAFQQTAQALSEDDFPQVTPLSDGGIFAARLDETVPPRERPLKEVRAQAVEGWKAEEAQRRLRDLARTLKGRAQSGTALSELGYDVQSQKALTRNAVSPPALRDRVFDLAKAGALGIASAEDAVFLVRLDEILPPEADTPTVEQLRSALTQRARQGIASDAFTYYARAVTDEAGLSLDQSAINAVHSQFP